MIHLYTAENYIKAIRYLIDKESKVSIIMLANSLKLNSTSVISMIKKLVNKKWVIYNKKEGVKLTIEGQKLALKIIRAHRLWEFFLSKKLSYHWDEIHEIAEELEHIKAPGLLERLEHYLNYPTLDPHGDPIPKKNGILNISNTNITLYQLAPGNTCRVVAVKDSSRDYLQYLKKLKIEIGDTILFIEKIFYDNSIIICIKDNLSINVSKQFAENLLIKKC